jgi:hypothetical protein
VGHPWAGSCTEPESSRLQWHHVLSEIEEAACPCGPTSGRGLCTRSYDDSHGEPQAEPPSQAQAESTGSRRLGQATRMLEPALPRRPNLQPKLRVAPDSVTVGELDRSGRQSVACCS